MENRKHLENTAKMSTKNMAVCGLMTAVMCIFAPLSIPLPGNLVPISLGVFVLYLSAYVLNWKYAVLSCFLYLLIGMAGLPVFSGYGSGLAKVAGPTGGYLIGYVFISFICGFVNEKFSGKMYMSVLGMVAGLALTYAFGTLWFSVQQHMGFGASLAMCVYPFLIGDGIKIAAAAIIGPVLRKRINMAKESG